MRANLLSVNGDGSNLTFSFKGEGVVNVTLAKSLRYYDIDGADEIFTTTHMHSLHKKRRWGRSRHHKRVSRFAKTIQLSFQEYGVHTVTIQER